MSFDRFASLRNMASGGDCLLSYVGCMSEDILEVFGRRLRERMRALDAAPAQHHRVFSLFVEVMQNMIRYGDEGSHAVGADGGKPGYGMLAVSRDTDRIVVMGGNYVTARRAAEMSARLDSLASSSREELRGIFRRQLRCVPSGSSKGANLGLIEMTRRSTTPPCYRMERVGDGRVFFMIMATV